MRLLLFVVVVLCDHPAILNASKVEWDLRRGTRQDKPPVKIFMQIPPLFLHTFLVSGEQIQTNKETLYNSDGVKLSSNVTTRRRKTQLQLLHVHKTSCISNTSNTGRKKRMMKPFGLINTKMLSEANAPFDLYLWQNGDIAGRKLCIDFIMERANL